MKKSSGISLTTVAVAVLIMAVSAVINTATAEKGPQVVIEQSS
ncbi:hypothetical protein [Gayadomonas joobiniege]|nr:hypothetical protein [Gayadomonas joobiniege]